MKLQETCSLKRISKESSSSHHQIKDDEVETRSKRTKIVKIYELDFLTYLLENKPRNYFEAMFCHESSY
jgi:hypothetical protein